MIYTKKIAFFLHISAEFSTFARQKCARMKKQQVHKILLLVIAVTLLIGVTGCRRSATPRPYGYYRIDLPAAEYVVFDGQKVPVKSEVSRYATVLPQEHEGEGAWMNIHYDMLNADIHCSYMPVHGNLRELTDDAMEFVYKHVTQASAIPEREFLDHKARVYCVLFNLQGNTASPIQFFMTDSTQHFFRGAVYCNCRPNVDSLQPVLDYLDADIAHFIETFEWKK